MLIALGAREGSALSLLTGKATSKPINENDLPRRQAVILFAVIGVPACTA